MENRGEIVEIAESKTRSEEEIVRSLRTCVQKVCRRRKQTARGLIVYYSPLIGALDPAVDIWIVSAY